jgi:hypothetical protein
MLESFKSFDAYTIQAEHSEYPTKDSEAVRFVFIDRANYKKSRHRGLQVRRQSHFSKGVLELSIHHI